MTFDVTSETTSAASLRLAKRLGLTSFYDAYRARTGTVALLDPQTKKPAQVFYGETNARTYDAAIDVMLAGKR